MENLFQETWSIIKWYLKGKPVPPPQIVKQKLIKKYAKRFNCQTLVETGTCEGDTINRLKNNFSQIFSIELSEELYKRAKNRLAQYPHIHILLGDSANILPTILPKLNGDVIFWLDGHYSGGITAKAKLETPIIKELEAIFSDKKNSYCILVDDARLFIGQNDYPKLADLASFVAGHGAYKFRVINDVIVIHK